MTNKAFYGQDFWLGILGGGQLGKMLIQACGDLNVTPIILDQDETVPAAKLATHHIKGHFSRYEDVIKIGQQVDLLTIEIEHVNLDALFELQERGLPIYPEPEVLHIIQDKGRQKDFYWDNGIPTANYRHIEDQKGAYKHQDWLPAFQKSCKAGYDGKGVQQLKNVEDLPKAFDTPSILEAPVACEKELSVIVARTPSGQLMAYPPVEMVFHPKQNLVEYLFSPAEISDEKALEASRIARDVAHKLGVVGLLAVELFLTPDGQILVNESAPRPHNSGHHTIEANETSQYEQHLRAILDLPLGNPNILSTAAMVNILGEAGHWGRPFYQGLEQVLSISGAHPHIYGKPTTKPYRKMGHTTVTAPTPDAVKQKAKQVKETLKVISHDK